MARAIWTGSISFGLVSIPVGLYSAVSEKTIRFHQLERGTSDRVRNKRVNERTGEEVEYRDIVKGYDAGDGQYVVVTPDELESVEPTKTHAIEIEDFVDQADIDPIFYDQTYYVGPKTDAAARPYALLIDAMRESGKVAVARFVMRGKEHLAAIRTHGDVLALETMHFADEIRDAHAELEVEPTSDAPKERELTTAISLIESMSTTWEPDAYQDRYRERVQGLIDEKLEGREIVLAKPVEEESNVVDLMEALRRSVDEARESRKDKDSASSRSETSSKADAKSKKPTQGEQLAMMSREELYQLASDIKVPGRSKMSRDELRRAVEEAQARQAS